MAQPLLGLPRGADGVSGPGVKQGPCCPSRAAPVLLRASCWSTWLHLFWLGGERGRNRIVNFYFIIFLLLITKACGIKNWLGPKGCGCLGLRALGQAHVIVPGLQGIKVNGSRPFPRWRWCLIVLNGCFSFINLSNCFS